MFATYFDVKKEKKILQILKQLRFLVNEYQNVNNDNIYAFVNCYYCDILMKPSVYGV